MRLITWNINSVRLRLPLLLKLMREQKPDVVCLQETKCPDEFFPAIEIAAAGYPHQHIHGMKSYNGVAILSRLPLAKPGLLHWQEREDCRHIHARLSNGLEIHNIYVPAGGDIPDPKANPKFAHKLGFVEEQTAWWEKKRGRREAILVGDLNIAPLEHDVWSHKQLLDVVSHTPQEVTRLNAMLAAYEWVDAHRHIVPHDQKLYTWWSYRAQDWEKSDRGRRLDHVWVTPDLRGSLKNVTSLKAARGWTQPSDHVPVVLDLDLA